MRKFLRNSRFVAPHGLKAEGRGSFGRKEKMGAVAIIPARAGSKRIRNKNMRELCGRPMLAYTIEAALASRVFDRVVVSTDSREVADAAAAWGAEAPFLREAELADDHTPASAVTVSALERLDQTGEAYEFVAQLLPNCPLRSAEDVRTSFHHFCESGAPAQISVTRFGWLNPWWARREESGRLMPLFPEQVMQRSQDLPELFCPTGAIWWARADALRRHRTFYLPGHTGWEIPWHRAVDIDAQEDWRLAELLMRARLAGVTSP